MPTPNPYADYQKTGLKKMLALAKVLCDLTLRFKHIILANFPDSLPIAALLIAIENLCTKIPDADAEFQAFNQDVTLPPSDPSTAAGVDPSAPAAVAPDAP